MNESKKSTKILKLDKLIKEEFDANMNEYSTGASKGMMNKGNNAMDKIMNANHPDNIPNPKKPIRDRSTVMGKERTLRQIDNMEKHVNIKVKKLS